MRPLEPGLYEQVINSLLADELEKTEALARTQPIDLAEGPKILAKYMNDILEKAFSSLEDSGDKLEAQIHLANKLLNLLADETGQAELAKDSKIDLPALQLLALVEKVNSIYVLDEKAEIPRPISSIAQSGLFTGAVHEPSLYTELKKEISSCDRIDMLVSFIKWSGLRLIIDELRAFSRRGGKLRIITTSYMGATDAKAIEELNKLLNTQIKVSYDTKRTRLHAKAYIFYRKTGFSTAYVGSSNLSNAAMSDGLEWNVKVTAQDQPSVMKKIAATFESYLHSDEFENYSLSESNRLREAINAERYSTSSNVQYLFDIRPYPFQQEILDKLEAERTVRNRYRNLIVSATGTGKTVICALDYKRFILQRPQKTSRLLFIAHRKEILEQSVACFRAVLRDQNFGDLFVGEHSPSSLEHLFMSVQTFNSQEFEKLTSPDFYDYVVVDEFHHAAAPTYKKLLNYYKSKILMGLTATPERMDGKSVLSYFDDRIAAEIRLPEAIERKLLSPFQYFGVTDNIDLDDLKWVRGGYQVSDLNDKYVLNTHLARQRATLIVDSLIKYVADIDEVRGLGFCASVEHARFMSDFFNENGIPSIHLTGQSSPQERSSAKTWLTNGELRFIFVVDIYNEGVDIPEVNTVLFLRPTESLTVFLQQLGRGLRLSDGKDCLTVLDFVGQANKKYNFEDRFAALLFNTEQSVQREIKKGFPGLPKGCYIQLERKAEEYILKNIRSSFGLLSGLISRVESFEEDSGLDLTLSNFASFYHLDIRNIYSRVSFARLKARAGLIDGFNEPNEEMLTKAFFKIASINSRRWILFLIHALSNIGKLSLSKEEELMLKMFHFTLYNKTLDDSGFTSVQESLAQLKANPLLLAELLEILEYNFDRIDFIDHKPALPYDCPLDVHCQYTRDQILVGLGYVNPSTVREGVKYLPDLKTDVFFITLNKSDKDYSPTTMYDDYSINESLFHWQSQSTTSESSPTGQRYINHKSLGSKVLLFVREYKNELGKASPYTFLGLADYIGHEGSRPMSITWRLHKPIPAKFLKKTNKLVVS